MGMSILSVPLKSGSSLYTSTSQLKLALGVSYHLLISSVLITVKALSRSRYINPEISLSANGTCALDLETKDIGRISWRWQIDVA